MRALPQLVFPKRSSAVASLQGSVGSWRSATTLHRRAAMYGRCVLFSTKWNAEFD
jgi:hypothetical protein